LYALLPFADLSSSSSVTGDKKTTELVQLLKGDDETTNVAVGHPYEPLLAVSGIDYTVKLFSPDQELQREFGEMAEADAGHESTSQGEYSGYGSRRKLSERDHITRQNAVASETGVTNAVITVSFTSVALPFVEWQALWE
jgi:nuclear receptor interaction protein